MDKLFALIPRVKLEERLNALCACLRVPVQLLDEAGETLLAYGEKRAYCERLQKDVFSGRECENAHLKAGQIAFALGQSYICSCPANVNLIAFPLANRKLLLGAVIIGPFLMDTPDSTLLSDFSEKRGISPALCLDLYDELQSLPVISPAQVKQISLLTDFLFEPLLAEERLLLRERQEKLSQQSRINEVVQSFKGNGPENRSDFFRAQEKKLLSKVRACDLQQAKAILNELLGFVLLVEGNQMEVIRSRATELTTLLSRVAIDQGANADAMLRLNMRYLDQIRKAHAYEELCFTLQEIVLGFMENISRPQAERESPAIRKAVRYIGENFRGLITLEGAARAAGLSPAYFSALFAREMRMGFHEYVTRVRLEEARSLLTATDYPINQIAVSVGYADQSSFTKAFRRLLGITPLQWRNA